MKPRVLLILFGLIPNLVSAGEWTSSDGKTIDAEFVRLNGDHVVLKMDGTNYPVPLARLDEKSQAYAKFMQEGMNQWAMDNLDTPIIGEQMLLDIVAFNPKFAEGQRFLVEGFVENIRSRSSLSKPSSTAADVKLVGGTLLRGDFAFAVEGSARNRVSVEKDKIVLMRATEYSNGAWRGHVHSKTLVEVGKPIIIHATVEGGAVKGTGMASTEEITEAQLVAAQRGGLSIEEASRLEQMKIRITYLEAQLKGNAGTATVTGIDGDSSTVVFRYSEEEKEAMRREIESLRAQIAAASR